MRVRAAVGAGLVAALVGTALVAGAKGGFPATRPRLLSGAAWLASVQVGQLTLLDGSSAEVAAQVSVAAPGERLDVVQQAATGYAVNRSTGTIRRVDGATFAVTDPARPLPAAGDGLRAFAAPDTLYALDTRRGLLTGADPQTLTPRGTPVPLAASVSGQAAALDEQGHLWVLDIATGDLVWIEHGRRHTRTGVAGPGAGLLVLAGGSPVVVDTGRGTASVLDRRTGAPRTRIGLALRPDDAIEVGGSPHADRLYVVAARGVVEVCPLSAGTCPTAIPLGTDGPADLGTPIETAGRLFVPDYTAGRVWIVDLDRSRVVAQPQVLTPKTRFQLLTRDGVVFFNDPDSEHAGVIRLDGGVRQIAKYDPKDPAKGTGTSGDAAGPDAAPKDPAPNPAANPAPNPVPQPPTTAPKPRPTPTPTPTGPGQPPPTVDIAVAPNTPLVGADAGLQAVGHDGTPVDARWDFGDGSSGTGTRTSHQWTTARTYQVSVRATFPGGRTARGSRTVTVVKPPTLTVHVSGNGSVSGAGISGCRSTCTAVLRPGQRVPLTATPDGGSGLRAWGGACTGSRSCTVTMTGDRTVSASFVPRPTLTVEEPSGGTVTGPGINCPPTCGNTYNPGQQVTLTAVPDGDQFLFWGGACAGTKPTCRLTMNGDRSVQASFGFADPCPPVCAPTRGPGAAARGVPVVGPGRAARRRRTRVG